MPEDGTLSRGRKLRFALAMVLGAMILGLAIGCLITLIQPAFASAASPDTSYSVTENGYSGNSTQDLISPVVTDAKILSAVEAAEGAVVTVYTDIVVESDGITAEGNGLGSGVIYRIDEDAEKVYIITNAHVIDDVEAIYLYYEDQDLIEAQLVGEDADADVAVISVDMLLIPEEIFETMDEAVWAVSADVRAGDVCIALGCPYATDFVDTATLGVVSATEREISYDGITMTVMQTDAAINPGNSGGPVINDDGQVIGICNAKIQDDSVEGIGFFIPSDTVLPIVAEILEYGSIEHPSLGIASYDLISEAMAGIYDVPTGIVVYGLEDGSAGAEAGLQVGDIITQIDGTDITSLEDLDTILDTYEIGDTVELTVVRDYDRENTVTITLTLSGGDEDSAEESDTGSFFNNQQDDE